MKKFFWLLGHNLSRVVRYSTAQFVVIILGLCASAIACVGSLQFVFDPYFQVDSAGNFSKIERIAWSNVASSMVIAAILIAFAMFNIIAIFRHLTGERRKLHLVYKMYGCSRGELFFLPMAEQTIYLILGGALAAGIYALIAGWLERMCCTVFPQAYWGLAIYAGVVLIAAAISSLTAAGARLNKREG